jgi:hypothetical protein
MVEQPHGGALKPFKKGQSGNPKGLPKGTPHLSTIIKELADNMDWSKTTLKNKDELAKTYGKNGFKAMVYVALTKAMAGDTKAMEWLAKYGYGQKIDITSNENDLFNMNELVIKVVKAREDDTDTTKPEATDSI